MGIIIGTITIIILHHRRRHHHHHHHRRRRLFVLVPSRKSMPLTASKIYYSPSADFERSLALIPNEYHSFPSPSSVDDSKLSTPAHYYGHWRTFTTSESIRHHIPGSTCGNRPRGSGRIRSCHSCPIRTAAIRKYCRTSERNAIRSHGGRRMNSPVRI